MTVYITGNKTAEDLVRAYLEKKAQEAANPQPEPEPVPEPEPTSISNSVDFFVLENISCVDADGHEFEQYGKLLVAKDIVRNLDNSQVNKTPYQWIAYHEQNGLFLPSFALSCNILAALYQNKSNSEVNQVLMQYKNRGLGYGWHAQNTIVKWNKKNGEIIHYPGDADFPKYGGSDNVNQASRSRVVLPFIKAEKGRLGKVKNSLTTTNLEGNLQDPLLLRFVKQFTGLHNPEILVKIGKYFQKPARVWFPSNIDKFTDTRACWLGGDYYFDLDTDDNLGDCYASRGVRRE